MKLCNRTDITRHKYIPTRPILSAYITYTQFTLLKLRNPYNQICLWQSKYIYFTVQMWLPFFSLYVMILLTFFFVCLFCQLDFLNPFCWSLIIRKSKSYITIELNNFYCLSNGWRFNNAIFFDSLMWCHRTQRLFGLEFEKRQI